MAKKASVSTGKKSTAVPKGGTAVADADMAVQTVQVAIPDNAGIGAEKADGSARREISHQQIAERAYELYNSGAPGAPDDHWLQAETELRSR